MTAAPKSASRDWRELQKLYDAVADGPHFGFVAMPKDDWRAISAALSERLSLPKKGPRRACVLTALLEADTKENMVRAVYALAGALERYELTTGVCGSPSHGAIYEYSQNSAPIARWVFRADARLP